MNDDVLHPGSTVRAAIVGGGIAGAAAALSLQRAGIDATVYEAQPARGDIGGGMSIAPTP